MELPLHPKLVHLPIALAVIVPLIAAGVWLAWYRGFLPMRSWLIVVALQALLVGGGLAAMRSGEAEEDVAERVVAEQYIEAHEEAAEAFMVAAWIVLGAAGAAAAAMFRQESLGRTIAGFATLGSLVVLWLGFQVGQAGGELVYTHGAASAYVASGAGQATTRGSTSTTTTARANRDDDD